MQNAHVRSRTVSGRLGLSVIYFDGEDFPEDFLLVLHPCSGVVALQAGGDSVFSGARAIAVLGKVGTCRASCGEEGCTHPFTISTMPTGRKLSLFAFLPNNS